MAKNLLTDYICKVCGKDHNSVGAFTQHIQSEHGITKSDYTIKYLLDGVIPTCACGCGKSLKVNGYEVNEYVRGHSGGGTWQTVYDKNSEEYKNALTKLSKSVKKSLSENPHIFTLEERDRRSKFMKSMSTEERDRRVIKMTETKRRQAKEGTYTHYTKIKSKEELEDIYKRVGTKSSKTKLDKFASGESVSWSKGLNKNTNEIIRNRSGENHHKFNPNKDIPYSEKFYDKEYRKILREQQSGVCFKCKDDTKILCLHHIDENKTNDSFDNLIFVCRSCHSKIHNNKEFKYLFDREVKEFKQNIILNKT